LIDSKTRLFCLIGNPVEHSLSPAMHNAAFKAIGMNAVYLAFSVRNAKHGFNSLKELGFYGGNVTMPLKQNIIGHLDVVDPTAKKIGAVNTIALKNNRYTGFNTDGIGARNALKKVTELDGKNVLLFGAGGAARAISFYLKQEGAELTILDKDFLKAKNLARLVDSKHMNIKKISEVAVDVLINATPVGMKPFQNKMIVSREFLKKEMVVFDIVYEPVETKLLSVAKSVGCTTVNGIEMLLEQGFASFEIFTGYKAPELIMREVVLNAINSRAD